MMRNINTSLNFKEESMQKLLKSLSVADQDQIARNL
jgi:hypothetical protein